MNNEADSIIKKHFGNDYHGLSEGVHPGKIKVVMEEHAEQRAIHFAKWADDKVVYMKNGEMDPTWDDLYVEYQKQLKTIKSNKMTPATRNSLIIIAIILAVIAVIVAVTYNRHS